jgi:hypothetical protein
MPRPFEGLDQMVQTLHPPTERRSHRTKDAKRVAPIPPRIMRPVVVTASAVPQMTCDRCGLVKQVTKSPESTRAWFKKWHWKLCDGEPVYTAGIAPELTQLEE